MSYRKINLLKHRKILLAAVLVLLCAAAAACQDSLAAYQTLETPKDAAKQEVSAQPLTSPGMTGDVVSQTPSGQTLAASTQPFAFTLAGSPTPAVMQSVSAVPASSPTAALTIAPSAKPTCPPTAKPTPKPSAKLTVKSTPKPAAKATPKPTPNPTLKPTLKPAATPTATPSSGYQSSKESYMIGLVNKEREKEGLPALKYDSGLRAGARKHSMDMSTNGFFSHTSPTYGDFSDRFNAAGFVSGGENIAMYGSIDSAHKALMNSSGHRANIMHKSYTRIGIGIVYNSERKVYYITQWFSK